MSTGLPQLAAERAEGVRARCRGRAVVLFVLYGYFAALIVQGGHLAWGWLKVPATSPSFLDLRSITTGWQCTRRGIDVLALNPCDPMRRPANYPRLWMWPASLGLGQSATLVLGLLLAVVFFGAALALMGRLDSAIDGVVWGAVLISPAIMLGVERGNADLLVFAVVVGAVLLLRSRRAVVRVAAHALFLVAAVLKLFPVFAFVTLLRQPRRWVLVGAGIVALGFVVDAALTLGDIRTIERVLPQEIYYSYGADIAVRATVSWLAAHASSLAFLAETWPERIVRWTCIGLAIMLAAFVARRWRPPVSERASERELDLFLAGAAIFAGTFILEHNFDYRLAFVLLAVPALLRWARSSRLAVTALAVVIVALWLSGWLSGWYFAKRYPLPYDEIANWLLFSLLVGMAVAAGLPRLAASRRVRSDREAW